LTNIYKKFLLLGEFYQLKERWRGEKRYPALDPGQAHPVLPLPLTLTSVWKQHFIFYLKIGPILDFSVFGFYGFN